MSFWINLLFVLGILSVLAGIVLHSQGQLWGQWLILGGLAMMIPYFFRRTVQRDTDRQFRRRR